MTLDERLALSEQLPESRRALFMVDVDKALSQGADAAQIERLLLIHRRIANALRPRREPRPYHWD
jgi:hypothetical protein